MNRNILSFRFKKTIVLFSYPSQWIWFLILFFFCFPFLNCATTLLLNKQSETSFDEYVKLQLRLLQNEKRPILELSYIVDGKPKFRYYCASPSSSGNSNKEYSYDIHRLKLDDECDLKGGDEDISRIRVENPFGKLFLPDIGTAIVLPWWDLNGANIILYRGTPIRKTISNIQEAWTVGWGSDERLCLSDSKNRTLALDCSKEEKENYTFGRRRVCVRTSTDCSKTSTSKSLPLLAIPRTPPTYFIAKVWDDKKDGKTFPELVAIAVWLYEPKSTQKGSSIIEIEFLPEAKQFSPGNVIGYGMRWLLLPFTLAIDIVAFYLYFHRYY
ncbi:hypothetical protein [Leptospira kirschneri]|uniref:hypothetical protein n=1 Tax=Leptospira kirschneri TaxID=29507 RepID=UPI000289A971|nr:hypothetical protein [Leptospira kirschneri]EKQ83373.1 hypothetical protein LEP1GSC064_1096 [Leptospira kirschneri serovar Grippotyphosa str. Moskva]EKR08108.1 hypothetical protein LEP1GSC122_2321 [Leptospira kirschneri serovar Valbuzzi str. 200702274]EMK05011.1 hypothetical protein LEP1GSC176_1965 [Leptospira kirschneri str. MMD1493]EMK13904.1 hypothetical protein LEP1GSC042_3838 [Leptospira kirschneri serovar Bim str. PUO 1247]EMN06472.1 hypothetical protein LEP1GSC046_1059 [Leptospira ki